MANKVGMPVRAAHTAKRPSEAAGIIARAMAGCAPLLPLLLTLVNVLLAMIAGGALVTAARLKWDPSTYVAVRLVFPTEYAALAAMLTLAGSAMVLLPLFAVSALACRRPRLRRGLILVYAVLMGALMLAEAAWGGWMVHRVLVWMSSKELKYVQDALRFRQYIKQFFSFMNKFVAMPTTIMDLIEEVEEDVPRNLYVVVAGAMLLMVLQVAAVALAAVLALSGSRARSLRRLSHSSATTISTLAGDSSEKAPLRTAYKNGRIVIL